MLGNGKLRPSKRELAERVAMTRSFALRLFLDVKSPSDFYISDLMNCFIALAQQPLSFAVYRGGGEFSRPLFHFCSDKEHYSWFVNSIKENPPSIEDGELFPFFPSILGNQKFYISIHWMHTKTCLGGTNDTRITREELPPSFSKGDYIARCAEAYFVKRWDGFDSDFQETAQHCLSKSIERISNNDRGSPQKEGEAEWPKIFQDYERVLKETPHPNSNKESWHNVVSEIFSKTIRNLDFGNRAIAGLSHKSRDHDRSTDVFPQNMLLMYRAFDRDGVDTETGLADQGRHFNENGSYAYNIRFLLDDPGEGGREHNSSRVKSIRSYLRGISEAKLKPSRDAGAYSPVFDVLYSNIFDDLGAKKATLRGQDIKVNCLKMIAIAIDTYFWERLSSDQGIDEHLECFKKPVGNKARGMGDPVFSTGLIHTNNIFSFGGLDRVDVFSIVEREESLCDLYKKHIEGKITESDMLTEFSQIWSEDASVVLDLRRIVVFYYIFLGMALEGSMNSADVKLQDAKKLTAILMPVKMRGSVWGITVHASLLDIDTPEDSFWNSRIWVSTFYLMTSQMRRYKHLIDNILWNNAERRVMRVIAECMKENSHPDWNYALSDVNRKLQSEQRLVPYVFPQLQTNVSKDFSPDEGQYFDVGIPFLENPSNRVFQVFWTLPDNPFFSARQSWDGKHSRSFKQAAELGWHHGMLLRAARQLEMQAKRKN